ncbi:molybdopterin-dependent oxidoreductase [Malonomonas rubra]|uniref:molybdopterin-containing oxidoreductase family protein n=1 Tax=Malonomonas rubra TaxID=57040 RepID=UPI0026F22F26|nr:molybdopterin-dependent oxidoreductase [Malonomonas rubra]
MKRRSFLQLSGMSLASSMLAGCRKGNEKLIPFLVPPEDGAIPGIANYYASTCRQCPAGCGVLVRVHEGRAQKVEGNPHHPVNQGKLCARGQAMLQELYHPDRIKQPLKRTGIRGSGQFIPISWDEALKQLAGALAPYQQKEQEGLLLFSAPLRGSLARLTGDFLQHFPKAQHLAWEPLSPEWLQQGLFGNPGIPDYDLGNTQYLLSFGADFLESHLSPVRYGHGFGHMRQERQTVRGRYSYIGPRLSLTAASADRWLPARPGTEWALAFGIIRRLLQEKSFDASALQAAGLSVTNVTELVANFNVQRVAEIADISPTEIRATINEAVSISPALALVGEMTAWQSNGSAAVAAVELLNLMLGNINRPGGLYFTPATDAHISSNYAELTGLIERMQQKKVQLALIYGCNPVFSIPSDSNFSAALANIPQIISFASFLDETSLQADLILPDHSNLESWGDIVPPAGTRQQVIGLIQPVVKPLHNTRAFPDVLLALAKGMGGNLAMQLPHESYLQWLEEDLIKRIPDLFIGDRRQQMDHLLQQGGWFGPELEPISPKALKRPERVVSPEFSGAQEQYPLQLQVYASVNFYDGRSSHLPWLQQLPDPMTTVVWGNWLEINPQTARKLGVNQGDLVEVSSPAGKLTLPAVLYPGLRPEVVACPIGQGHQGLGRYADRRGENPLKLIKETEASKQRLTWGGTRVQVRRLAASSGLVTAGHAEGSYHRDLLGL